MKKFLPALFSIPVLLTLSLLSGCAGNADRKVSERKDLPEQSLTNNDEAIEKYSKDMLDEGRKIFRYDTFGSEKFWGDQLQLHKAIAGKEHGGVGDGLTPNMALKLGLKVDTQFLPSIMIESIKNTTISLDKPETTLALLKAGAVVGVTGFFDKEGNIKSIGIQCAFCHSTVDNWLTPGIGKRLDGWANRDLDVGAIVALAPNLKPFTDLLGVDTATVKKVLHSWGPGRYDAELDKDGKALRPDGKQAGTLIPPAFGLAGVNLHTWTGFGSVPYWNAYVAVTQMHGSGTFFDTDFNNRGQYPVSAKSGSGNTRGTPDRVTPGLAALHIYQLSIPAPKPAKDSFNAGAATRGEAVFNGKAKCASCHVPPLFTEPGSNLHAANEIGIDDFQARRSPTGKYRTAPLAGLWTHQKGGFYHDGRFASLADVVEHYDGFFKLSLTDKERNDLVEYLKSL
jgi:hypothetical protein